MTKYMNLYVAEIQHHRYRIVIFEKHTLLEVASCSDAEARSCEPGVNINISGDVSWGIPRYVQDFFSTFDNTTVILTLKPEFHFFKRKYEKIIIVRMSTPRMFT